MEYIISGSLPERSLGGYYRGACNEGERRLGIPDADIDHFPQKTKTQARNGMRRSACPDVNLSTDTLIKKYLKRTDIKARKNSNNDSASYVLDHLERSVFREVFLFYEIFSSSSNNTNRNDTILLQKYVLLRMYFDLHRIYVKSKEKLATLLYDFLDSNIGKICFVFPHLEKDAY